MAVQFLVFVLILLVTGFYARQGLLTALLTLITSIFASILAMGLYEPLSEPLIGFRPDYARGVTFLLLFFLSFSALQFAMDYAVPKNIKLSKLTDSVGGGVFGFFAGLVIVGMCVIGQEMLPVGTNYRGSTQVPASLGFERFPGEGGMQKLREDGTPEPGVVADHANLVFWPDRFTLALWNGASGRGLAAARAFGDVHPDLSVESYGYRNTVEAGVKQTLVPDLLKVPAAYYSDAATTMTLCHTPENKVAAVVRIEVDRGSEEPKVSADNNQSGSSDFNMTASEIRLVTDHGHQYYPTGHLVNGTAFEALPLDTGHVIDEYAGSKLVEDMVFAIDPGEKPALVEVKQLARVFIYDKSVPVDHRQLPCVELAEKPVPALASSLYAKRSYRETSGTIDVAVTGLSQLTEGKAYLLAAATPQKNLKGTIDDAHNALVARLSEMSEGTGTWAKTAGTPGVPSQGTIQMAVGVSREAGLKNRDEPISWSEIVPVFLIAASTPQGEENLGIVPRYFVDKIEPLFRVEEGSLRAESKLSGQGKAVLKDLAVGNYCLIVTAKSAEGYYVWTSNVSVKEKEKAHLDFDPQSARFSVMLKK